MATLDSEGGAMKRIFGNILHFRTPITSVLTRHMTCVSEIFSRNRNSGLTGFGQNDQMTKSCIFDNFSYFRTLIKSDLACRMTLSLGI